MKAVIEHMHASRFAEAAGVCRDILKKKPRNADALHFLGLAEWQLGGPADGAIKLIRLAIAAAPNQSFMHHNLATVLGSAGDLEEAEKQFRTAIRLKPDYAEAYFNLSGIKKFAADDPAIAGMKALYAAPDLSSVDQEFICYALAKAHDDIGAYEEAFHFALEGARLKDVTFDIDAFKHSIGELTSKITVQSLKPVSGRGQDTVSPIFIVGMPRSGTTLVEQILSRHSEVFAGGELPTINSFHDAMLQTARAEWGYKGVDFGFWPMIPVELVNSAGAAFAQFIAGRAGGDPVRFTDKMPRNAFYLGLIAMMFPNARVVHVRRHPLDTCVSCFFQRFRTGQKFSFRLDWLGQYYRGYVEVMEHWRKVLPLEMLDVRYEEMVANPDEGARRLVAFAGLAWQDACLEPSASQRDVKTASRWQVRQPVYKSSVERWRRYEAYLDPLIAALGGHAWIDSYQQK